MLRKISAVLAMAMLVISAACNTVTGPAVDEGTADRDGGRGSRERQERSDKVCLDDLRAVQISSPVEGQILHNNQTVYVSFAVEHFCHGYTAAVEVSTDGGRTFQVIAQGRALASALWKLPQLDNLAPVVRVRAWDGDGTVDADRAFGFLYAEPRPAKRGQERD